MTLKNGYNIVDYYTLFNRARLTSDPRKYASGIFGLRKYTQNGIHHDAYCDGYHRAIDIAIDGDRFQPVASPINGEVVSGTSSHGNFGGTVVIANKGLNLQVIIGHLDRDILVKVGDKVTQGQVIGRQSHTNYYDNPMDDHVHIQFQPYKYYETEKEFVCSGINPFVINIPTRKYTVVKGDTLYSLARKFDLTVAQLKKLNNLKSDTINIGQELRYITKCKKLPKPKFETLRHRPRTHEYYYRGKIDKLGASVRNRSKVNGKFNWNKEDGELKPGDEVYIFEVMDGWGRIYTHKETGNGSNRWIWLERLKPTEITR